MQGFYEPSSCTGLDVGVGPILRTLVAYVDVAVLLQVDAVKALEVHLRENKMARLIGWSDECMNESESTRGRRTDDPTKRDSFPHLTNHQIIHRPRSVIPSSVGSAQAGLSVHMVGRRFNLISGERK